MFFKQFPKAIFDFQGKGIDTNITDIFRFVKADELYQDDMSVYTYYEVQNGDRPDIVSNLLYGTPDYYWTFFVVNEHLKSGMSGWPMSPEMFESYIETEYAGTIIETAPIISWDTNNKTPTYVNSLADQFNMVGQPVYGVLSGATGKVIQKDVQLSQLLLTDVTGTFRANEGIQTVQSIGPYSYVTSNRVFPHRIAPHHYEDGDGNISYLNLHINEEYVINAQRQRVTRPVSELVTDSVLSPVSNYQYETQLNDERSKIRVVRPGLIYEFVKTFKDKLNA